MNNEPIAWAKIDELSEHFESVGCGTVYKTGGEGRVPVYTHPVKELTDFEIKGVMALDECWIGEDCSMPNMIAFARAILRKTKEK